MIITRSPLHCGTRPDSPLGMYDALFPLTTTIRPGPLTYERCGKFSYNSFLPAVSLIVVGFNILSMKALAFSHKEEGYVTFAKLKGTPAHDDARHGGQGIHCCPKLRAYLVARCDLWRGLAG
ncbi:MAG: hypothetical protein R2932_16175 [Caldilineaceae bacterium]